MIRAANGDVDTDHVSLHWHLCVECSRPRVIAVLNTDPADALLRGLLNGEICRVAHHEVPHGVVAVDERHRTLVGRDADIRRDVDAATPDSLHILRQSKYTVPVGPVEICLRHEFGGNPGIPLRHSDGCQATLDKLFQLFDGYSLHNVRISRYRPETANLVSTGMSCVLRRQMRDGLSGLGKSPGDLIRIVNP